MPKEFSTEERKKLEESRAKSDAELFEGGVEVVRDPGTDRPRLNLTDEQLEKVANENRLRSVTIGVSKEIHEELLAESDPRTLEKVKARELPPATEYEARLKLINYQEIAGQLLLRLQELLAAGSIPPQRAQVVRDELSKVKEHIRQAAEKGKNIHVLMGPKDKIKVIWEHIKAMQQSREDITHLINTYFPGELEQGPGSTNVWSGG